MRSLLAAGRDRRPPDGARGRVWAELGVVLGAGAAASSTTATGAAEGAKTSAELASGTTTATSGAGVNAGAGTGGAAAAAKGASVALVFGKAKVLAIVAVLTTAGVSAVVVASSDRAQEAVGAPRTSAERAVAALEPSGRPPSDVEVSRAAPDEPRTEPEPEEETAPRPSPPPKRAHASSQRRGGSTVGGSSPVSSLREEASLLHEARAALSRGAHDVARAKLDEARARFPTSQLAPERDALEVRLASESGDRPRAARLAKAFVERYPDSPLRPGVEGIVQATEKD
ncbi:MAG: hypothetical protein KF782_27100 [Labilithrix sp.]|nr:hypothetical protein [Labilithrix sp.]